MTDLPPMDPCPHHKRGRHELSFVIPDEYDKDLTVICSHCGATRRMPVHGALVASRLDDLDAEQIVRVVRG